MSPWGFAWDHSRGDRKYRRKHKKTNTSKSCIHTHYARLRFSDETIGQKNLLTCVATFSPEDGKVPAYIKNISEMSNIWQKSISWDSKLETFLKGIADIDTKCVGVTVKNYLKIFVKSQVKYFVTISFLKCFPEVKLDPLCWKQFEKLMNEILPATDYGLMLWWYIAVQHFPKC